MSEYELIKRVCEGLISKYDENDPDFKRASEDEMIDNIIELFADCYTSKDFLEWLYNHDCDILIDYRFAYTKTYEEIAEELDNGEENDGVYNIDFEEWQAIDKENEEERKDYIKDHLDCLMSSDKVVVVSW